MKTHTYAVFLYTLILVAPLLVLDCQAQNAAAKNAAVEPLIESARPPISMGKPMTLSELVSAIHDTAGTTLDIEAGVYNKSFSEITKIYIAGARSLPEVYDVITQAAGLKWRTGEHGEIVLYRDGVPTRPNMSAVAKAN